MYRPISGARSLEQFHFIPPHSPLHDVLRAAWQIERERGEPLRERILPIGTVEVIFNLGAGARVQTQKSPIVSTIPRCFLNGCNSYPVALDIPGHYHLFGVVFQPAAIHRLLGIPATEFADRCLDLALVHPDFDRLWHQVGAAGSFAERTALFCRWLQERRTEPDLREPAFNQFLTGCNEDGLSVPALAQRLCYSPRQLSRRLLELTGRNTEANLLFRRYLRSMELLHNSDLSLTSVAYDCGFSDQSHFNRTFRAHAGLTPGEYRRQKSHLPGHLFEDVR